MNADFYWNFGDGTAARGQGIYHTYTYPGVYNVVMNLTQGDNQVVARTTVRVADPEIKLTNAILAGQPAVELKNSASTEVNLGGWRLSSGKKYFGLPEDTIIVKGGTIALPFEAESRVELVAPSGQVFASIPGREEEALLRRAQEQLIDLSATLAAWQAMRQPTSVLTEAPEEERETPAFAATVATATIIELPPSRTWWQAGAGFIKNIFD